MLNKLNLLNKRTIVTIVTAFLLAIALVAPSAGIAYAGDATSPSACGACAG